MKYEVNTVQEYLEAIPTDRKPVLVKLIEMITEIAPDTSEAFQHNLPFYNLDNKPLFALASQKHFMALYVTETDIVAELKDQLGKVSLGKSCIRFKNIDDLDLEVVRVLLTRAYARRLTNNEVFKDK